MMSVRGVIRRKVICLVFLSALATLHVTAAASSVTPKPRNNHLTESNGKDKQLDAGVSNPGKQAAQQPSIQEISLDMQQGKVDSILGPDISWRDQPDRIPEADLIRLEPGNSPEQIHLSLGNRSSDMVVMWATKKPPAARYPGVRYGLAETAMASVQLGNTSLFYNATMMNESLSPAAAHYHHRVIITELKPNTTYFYQIVCEKCYSLPLSFRTFPSGQDWHPSFLVYGDMGRRYKAPILKRLRKDALSGKYAAVIHVGDFAYDMHHLNGVMGDSFMRQIEPFASKLPYMTCPGNHEMKESLDHYLNRFSMPDAPWPMNESRLWYSFNVANIHFISYSTECYFFHRTPDEVSQQKKWLEQDLVEANHPSNRSVRPWVVAFGHRPMYCSNSDNDDCTLHDSIVRLGLEPLFYRYGVDLVIQGHEHSYERLWPVYDHVVWGHNYTNPGAPVHLVTGAAGCDEGYGYCIDPMGQDPGAWSAFRTWWPGTYGYGHLDVHNDTHLHWEQVLAVNGNAIDSFWLVQHRHGPFEPVTVDPRSASTGVPPAAKPEVVQ